MPVPPLRLCSGRNDSGGFNFSLVPCFDWLYCLVVNVLAGLRSNCLTAGVWVGIGRRSFSHGIRGLGSHLVDAEIDLLGVLIVLIGPLKVRQ